MVGRLVRIAVACALALAAAAAPAQSGVEDPADRLLREQRERERRERLERRTPEIALPGAAPVERDAAPESVWDPEPTFAIERIEVVGSPVLAPAEIERVTRPFLGKRLGVNRINLLLRRLTHAFVERGFVTTRAYVGSQNLAAGTLEITVVPGRVESLRYNGRELAPGGADEPGVRLAFPAAPGDIFLLGDIEQGVDQLNRLRRNHAEVQILPGQTPGGSVVAVYNTQRERLRYELGMDNSGSETTGSNRYRAGIEANDVLGLQEALTLSYVGSLDTNALLFAASLPWGYSTVSYLYAYSEFQSLIGDSALLFGSTRSHTLALNRVIARSRRGKSSLDLSLSLREARREVNSIELTPQELSVLRLAYSRLQRFGTSTPGFWTLDIGASRGLGAFGATRDAPDLPAEVPHAQFGKLDLSVALGLQVGAAWTYRGLAFGQLTRDALFSSEQIFVGGSGTVRGFAEAALAGDRGFYTRHELAYSRFSPLFEQQFRVEPFAFADTGSVELVAERKSHTLAGAGIGVRAGTRHVSVDVALARPLAWPDTVSGDGWRVHAALNISL